MLIQIDHKKLSKQILSFSFSPGIQQMNPGERRKEQSNTEANCKSSMSKSVL